MMLKGFYIVSNDKSNSIFISTDHYSVHQLMKIYETHENSEDYYLLHKWE